MEDKYLQQTIKQYEKDVLFLIKLSKSVKEITTPALKEEFEDLITDKIIEYGNLIIVFKNLKKQ